jgi:hypothetical protein
MRGSRRPRAASACGAGRAPAGSLNRPGFGGGSGLLRLVGAVLAEQNEEWLDTRRYMSVEALVRPDPAAVPIEEKLMLEQAA